MKRKRHMLYEDNQAQFAKPDMLGLRGQLNFCSWPLTMVEQLNNE